MITFESDYTEGAHIKILEKLLETNMEQLPGYGNDVYSKSAADKIKKACNKPDAEVYFVTGGTQTNALIISTMLNDYEGVIAAETGHVNCHESGAIEYTGHKVLAIPSHQGKIDAGELKDYILRFYADGSHEHMVFPGMVYISHPTEYGTLYSLEELNTIHGICREYDIPLFIDGARLGYGIMSHHTDVTLPALADSCEVFYIGGTKVGALCGEAIVFTDKKYMPAHFITMVKQHGAMVAKGRINAIQFDVLFTDNLYFDIAGHAIEMAEKLKKMFTDKGYRLFIDSPTNQQFIILDNEKMGELSDKVGFSVWEPYDDKSTVVRFATSWATTDENLEYLNTLL